MPPRDPPAGADPLPPNPVPPSPVPSKPRGGTALAVACAVVLVTAVCAGGWVGGRLYAGDPVLPLGAAAPTTGDTAPSPEPSPEGERVGYRGMSVALPGGWTSQTVREGFGVMSGPPEDLVEEEWLVLRPRDQSECEGNEWTWTDNHTGCRHLKVLGPLGIRYGGSGYGPIDLDTVGSHTSYTASGNPHPCPEGVPSHTTGTEEVPGLLPWEVEERDLGGEPARYGVGPTICYDVESQGFRHFEQRLWLVEDAGILVVDGYGLAEAEDVLATAEW